MNAEIETSERVTLYYREDTRLMYLSTVDSVTKALVEGVTSAKGIRVVKRYERRPVLGEQYKEKTSASEKAPAPGAEG